MFSKTFLRNQRYTEPTCILQNYQWFRGKYTELLKFSYKPMFLAYRALRSYPPIISAGLFVKRIGKSSVDYQVGMFENDHSSKASAVGGFTLIFFHRINRRPYSINDQIQKQVNPPMTDRCRAC